MQKTDTNAAGTRAGQIIPKSGDAFLPSNERPLASEAIAHKNIVSTKEHMVGRVDTMHVVNVTTQGDLKPNGINPFKGRDYAREIEGLRRTVHLILSGLRIREPYREPLRRGRVGSRSRREIKPLRGALC